MAPSTRVTPPVSIRFFLTRIARRIVAHGSLLTVPAGTGHCNPAGGASLPGIVGRMSLMDFPVEGIREDDLWAF